MNNIFTIYKKEFFGYFTSPMAYIFLVVFSIVNGYFFTNTFFLIGQSDMRALFNIVPMVYLFFIPAITMGIISKEKNIWGGLGWVTCSCQSIWVRRNEQTKESTVELGGNIHLVQASLMDNTKVMLSTKCRTKTTKRYKF